MGDASFQSGGSRMKLWAMTIIAVIIVAFGLLKSNGEVTFIGTLGLGIAYRHKRFVAVVLGVAFAVIETIAILATDREHSLVGDASGSFALELLATLIIVLAINGQKSI